ncbi:endonuclease III [archaeon]|jgi:endonuclease III|nr:endonuclease III [archaeon]
MKNISQIMNLLEKKYSGKKRTTLNRMRTKPDSFKILISCLLSLQAKDEITEKITERLFEKIKTPIDLLKISDKELEKIIFSSGHYKKKTQTLKSVSNELIERFDGKVPRTKKELLSIKGIGPKTANIVLAFAFGVSVLPIDTNCHRVSNRLGFVKTKNPEETEKELEKALPKKYWKEFNGIMMLFGKEFCLPRTPKCDECFVNDYCDFNSKLTGQ